ncbi:MAG: SRPBCC family protein [Acidimicrobiales bacterium]|jgi:uncharacterized protein YndB with AHSA1/START domain
MTPERGTIRREVRINAGADEVWSIVGDPARLAEWYPGIVSSNVDGDTRVITTGSGLAMPEQIVTVDPLQRRFQYRITAPMFTEHLATIDVVDLGDGTTLVTYGVDANPSMMALVLGGAAGNALANLRRMMEGAR